VAGDSGKFAAVRQVLRRQVIQHLINQNVITAGYPSLSATVTHPGYEPLTTRLQFGQRCFSHAGPKASFGYFTYFHGMSFCSQRVNHSPWMLSLSDIFSSLRQQSKRRNVTVMLRNAFYVSWPFVGQIGWQGRQLDDPGRTSNIVDCSNVLQAVTERIRMFGRTTYTVSGKKGATWFFAVTLPNPNRSSKFFYCHTQQ